MVDCSHGMFYPILLNINFFSVNSFCWSGSLWLKWLICLCFYVKIGKIGQKGLWEELGMVSNPSEVNSIGQECLLRQDVLVRISLEAGWNSEMLWGSGQKCSWNRQDRSEII